MQYVKQFSNKDSKGIKEAVHIRGCAVMKPKWVPNPNWIDGNKAYQTAKS